MDAVLITIVALTLTIGLKFAVAYVLKLITNKEPRKMKKRKPYLIIKEQPELKILVQPGEVKHFYESREIQIDDPKMKPKYSESVKAIFITAILGLSITVLPLGFLYLIYSF